MCNTRRITHKQKDTRIVREELSYFRILLGQIYCWGSNSTTARWKCWREKLGKKETKSGKKCEICVGVKTTVLIEPWCCWCNIFFEFKFWKCWNDKWKIKSIFEETKCVWLIGGKMWNFKFVKPVFFETQGMWQRDGTKNEVLKSDGWMGIKKIFQRDFVSKFCDWFEN